MNMYFQSTALLQLLAFCCIHENIDNVAVVAQELKHSLKQLAPARGCDVLLKLIRTYSRTRGGASISYLEKHELLCLYSLLDMVNHTGGI